jgi:hypothetical protein
MRSGLSGAPQIGVDAAQWEKGSAEEGGCFPHHIHGACGSFIWFEFWMRECISWSKRGYCFLLCSTVQFVLVPEVSVPF